MKIKIFNFAVLLFIALVQVDPVFAGNSTLMDSPWPVFHGDRKLTGQSPYDTSKIKGGIKWKFQAESQSETSPIIDKEGNIYFVDQQCYLYSVSPEGKEKWRFKAGEQIISKEWGGFGYCSQSTPAIDSEGTVYFLPMSGNFYAVDKDGKEKWHYPVFTFKNAWPSPAIGADGTIYVGSEIYPPTETGKPQETPAYFYAFNPDGTLKWKVNLGSGSWVNSAPSIADDGTIYTTSNDCKKHNCANGVFAVNPDGTTKWTFFPPNGVLEGSVVIGKDGTLYFTAKGADDPRKANFYALTPEGKEKWKFPLQNGASITPALTTDDKLYFGDWGGVFYALDLDGKELWRVQTPPAYEALSSSPAVGSDGSIYFGTIAKYFYAYTAEGQEKWKISLDDTWVSSAPAIGADGTVYFVSVKGGLYAVGEDEIASAVTTSSQSNTEIVNDKKVNSWPWLVYLFSALTLATLAILEIFVIRKTLDKKKIIILASILVVCIAGFLYLIIFNNGKTAATNNNQNNKSNSVNTQVDIKDKCPRRVYGSPDKGYYGIFEMQQIDLTREESNWVKNNCPDTYWIGDNNKPGMSQSEQ